MMTLPDSFKSSMKDLLEDEYDLFIKACEDRPKSAVRINTSKITGSEFEKIAPYDIEKIPFSDNGYYISDTDAWSKHPYYYAGLYYIQEPSAMLPGIIAPVDENSIVLDLCAAPGGKSTALCLKNPQILVSNDISFSRTMALVKNLEISGARGTFVTCCDPAKLADVYPETFDCIVVDAPCSGEGMFRKDHALISAYLKEGPEKYAPVQRNILECAYRMLKCGGYILYSTCTFSDIEDEKVIISFTDDHHDMSVCEIEKKYGLCGPYGKYSDRPDLQGCVHALWHRFKGEGHFIALMKKQGTGSKITAYSEKLCPFSQLNDEVKQFAKQFSSSYYDEFTRNAFLVMADGFIYMMTPSMTALYNKNIRYVRTGTCIGIVNRHGKFTPHTALALNMKSTDYSNTVSFNADDPMVVKYLKGETLPANRDSIPRKGYVLICVDSYPLGFASCDGTKLKNLYEKGWIIR